QAEDGIRDFHVTGVQTCALPIWIGVRMSGGDNCASTLPSLNSTIECTTDSGWITMSICSGGKSNSQHASINSRPLLNMLAESMRSEERRVGKEGRSRWSSEHEKK